MRNATTACAGLMNTSRSISTTLRSLRTNILNKHFESSQKLLKINDEKKTPSIETFVMVIEVLSV